MEQHLKTGKFSKCRGQRKAENAIKKGPARSTGGTKIQGRGKVYSVFEMAAFNTNTIQKQTAGEIGGDPRFSTVLFRGNVKATVCKSG